MNQRHLEMWTLVDTPEDVVQAIREGQAWGGDARSFAVS
jgi:hypothetical protein